MVDSNKEKLPFDVMLVEGGWIASCPLGLWSISHPDRSGAVSEGLRYYAQYKSGGEYD